VRDFMRHQTQVSRLFTGAEKDVIAVRESARCETSDDSLRTGIGVNTNRREIY
jgi:hypothetical protein